MNKNKDEIFYFFEEIYEYTVNNFKKKNKFKTDDLYFKIRQLQIDSRGSFGQKFIIHGLQKNGFKAIDDNDKNKDWDIKFENYRIEIKTATLDVNNKFQHEGIKKTDNYDLLLFLDIAPNQIFIKIFLYDEIDFSKLHQRGGGRRISTGVGYKFDYSFIQHLNEKNEIKYLTDLKKIFNEFKQKLDKKNIL